MVTKLTKAIARRCERSLEVKCKDHGQSTSVFLRHWQEPIKFLPIHPKSGCEKNWQTERLTEQD